MVRLSLVNMYLHGFVQPQIIEYDTLTSEDRWNEYADVILANPPFMTPKGGIKPHKNFSVQSNRSEVLFVDYIAEHLTPTGRAAVIVPEGIIFQSATAYKSLRKMLVENHLYAVVSLPAGIFNPYSGVKTSILLMDKQLAKKTDSILFVKIENDGFGLGAQRREIDKNDLPDAVNVIKDYVTAVRNGKPDSFIEAEKPCGALMVKKEKLAENGEYNLTGDRYRTVVDRPKHKYPEVVLVDAIDTITPPKKLQTSEYLSEGKYPIVDQSQEFITGYTNDEAAIINPSTPYIIFGDHTCAVKYIDFPFAQGADGIKILSPHEEFVPKYFYYFLKNNPIESDGYKRHYSKLKEIKIPIPPLEVQREIVAEIDGYQKLIVGCRQVIDAWKPQIDIDPEWSMVKLGDVCEIKAGGTPSTSERSYYDNGSIPWLKSEVCKDVIIDHASTFITEDGLKNSAAKMLKANSTLIALVGATIGKTGYITFEASTNQNVAGLYPLDVKSLSELFLFYATQSLYGQFMNLGDGNFKMANLSFVKSLEIPLPPLEIQQEIVAHIESERKVIGGCRDLIKTYEDKIKCVIDKVWEN